MFGLIVISVSSRDYMYLFDIMLPAVGDRVKVLTVKAFVT